MRVARIIVRVFALVSWTMVGMFFGQLAAMELFGTPPRDRLPFSDPIVDRLYLAGSIVLPILAVSLALGGDRIVCRSKRLVIILTLLLCTPLIHWVLVVMAISSGEKDLVMGVGLPVLELATIASIPFLLVTGYRMSLLKAEVPHPAWLDQVVVGGVVATTVGLMLVPVLYHPPSPYACLRNLKQIGLAIAMYSDSYQGRCPMDSASPTLVGSMQLLSNVLPSATVLYCPHDRRPNARAESDFKKLTTNNISYSYVPNLKWLDTPDSPLMLDRIYATSARSDWPKNGNHKDLGGNVLFNDGHVAWNNTLPSTLKDKDGKPVVLSP